MGVDFAHPINSIYYQLPTQSDPNTLFKFTTWTDITSSYAGAFFRAAGGDAAAFGTRQNQSTAVNGLSATQASHTHTLWMGSSSSGSQAVPYRYNTVSGTADWAYEQALSYERPAISLSGDVETRPTNYAIKIWKRTA
ncbi:hypothetical protein [Methanobrevibacter sp.]|uniref:hypothetical protein n=1 Tax=Methanobrevibacter sp. TaxID=66852 RepID=UPI00388FF419